MKIGVLKERRARERRVAATPDTVKKYIDLGFDVVVETGAGEGASLADGLYEEAGATICDTAAAAGADLVLKVQRPLRAGEGEVDELGQMKSGAMLISTLAPFNDAEGATAYAAAGVTAFSMEFMPRITRAQSMDVLSSQSNLAGYRAVIEAVHEYGRVMPMMMTAAGTVAPAKVFIMGAGVAGLQAIATAKRLGAIVSATDVRPAAGEQVESLGAKFVMVDSEETEEAETAGGYAKEMSEDYKRRQAELVAEHIKKQDMVITTALIPGRPAPRLISADMVDSMRAGSVILDMAVEQGGNCELSQPGETIAHNGVTIVGRLNLMSDLAADASALYAKNLLNFITLFVDLETKEFRVDWEDEIVAGTALTRDGAVVHPALKEGDA